MAMSTTRTRCQSDGPHGTYWAYSKGCRCLSALIDNSNYRQRRRSGNPLELLRDATGASRTARGLAVLGYTVPQIAAEAGVSERLVAQLHAGKDTIRASKDKALRAAADRLLAAPPPTGWAASIARNTAKRNGWAPLHAWDAETIDDPAAQPDLGDPDADVIDEVAVARALRGERVPLTRAERLHAFRTGYAAGMSTTAIAEALHVSGRRVRQLAEAARTDQAA